MQDHASPIGREQELAVALGVLDALADGPAALAITGPAGIGKTTIWRTVQDAARERGWTVVSTRAVEAEAQLAFSGLADLLDPVFDDVADSLPPAQRYALDVALQRAPAGESPPPALAIAMGTVGVFRTLSEAAPLVIAIDDLPWLDDATAGVLAYAVRRVGDSRGALVAAIRTTPSTTTLPEAVTAFDGPGTELHVGPLDLDAIDELARRHLGLSLRRPQLQQLVRASGGNPFHALELARRLESGSDAGLAAGLDPGRLARERLGKLDPATREPLAAVAALGRPTTEVMRLAAPDSAPAVSEATAAGVLEQDGTSLRFSHPLLAEAAYEALGDASRRALHLRLAEAVGDPEERARHLALGIVGEDEALAERLEAGSASALAKGSTDTAAELALQAATRTPVGAVELRHERLLAAAGLLMRAGDPERARSVLEQHISDLPRGLRRADALRVLAEARTADDWTAKARHLEEALSEAGDDHGMRSRLLRDLAYCGWHMVTASDVALEQVEAAVAEAELQDDHATRSSAYVADVFVRLDTGRCLDTVRLARALEGEAPVRRIITGRTWNRAVIHEQVDRIAESRTMLREMRDEARDVGDWDSLPNITSHLALVEFRMGEWQTALELALEAERGLRQIAHPYGLSFLLARLAKVSAGLGDVDEARRFAAEGIETSRACGVRVTELRSRAALGWLELSLGDNHAAITALEAATHPFLDAGWHDTYTLESLPDLAEALILSDRAAEVEVLMTPYTEVGERCERPAAQAASRRVTGQLASTRGDEEGAETAFAAALEHHARIPEPFERARTLHALGQSRRRFRRRGQARTALLEAVEIFDRLGATLWAERSRAELERTGHREKGAVLSATQQQIAELVVAGHTNREIAEQLFMSPHTVEAHLTKVYRSLGIRGRAELAAALIVRETGDG